MNAKSNPNPNPNPNSETVEKTRDFDYKVFRPGGLVLATNDIQEARSLLHGHPSRWIAYHPDLANEMMERGEITDPSDVRHKDAVETLPGSRHPTYRGGHH